MFKALTLALRLRYIIPATALGGYYTAKNKLIEIKSNLDSWTANLTDYSDTVQAWLDDASEAIAANRPRFGSPDTFRNWGLDRRTQIDQVNRASSTDNADATSTNRQVGPNQGLDGSGGAAKPSGIGAAITSTFKAVGGSKDRVDQLETEIRRKSDEGNKKNEELVALRKELDRIKKENRELRSAVRGGAGANSNQAKRKLKKSLIELYSEVLDELSGHDSTYRVQDHLPKVVVVGDQSSGKTSVLEMIAGARIFPRGAGEMMTRAPVQVTLSEGPYHVARFKDTSREFDLTRESELAELRLEIEDRMRRSVQDGKTVSNQVISLTIQGPGIQRMVLVDLPGIIGTVTNELAPDTKECIKKMVTEYMGNPNAIILCIQDGSLDAERSIFTDLVREIDKKGRRTILVLTKVDIAEKTHTNPAKIKKILDGELFPMKALGYYAVVAGKSGKNEDIQEIKDYEEQFFLTSSLCEKGILNPSQCTTRNLSSKVSECFWGMVKSSIEQQADAYKATLFNLEAEWNHLFPHMRQLTRDELYFHARNEILDEVAKLSRLSTKHWDQFISTQLWERVREYLIQKVYFPASTDPLHFSAKVDIELQRWVESLELPKLAIKVAEDSVRHQFDNLLAADSKSDKGHNGKKKDSSIDGADDSSVYTSLKKAVIHDALERHKWKTQALDVLRVVQLEALSKQITLTKDNWDRAIVFLQNSLSELAVTTSQELQDLTGYSWSQRWLKWKSTTNDQMINGMIKNEFDKLLTLNEHESIGTSALTRAKLNDNELITIKKNLESHGVEVDSSTIERLWKPYHRHSFLTSEIGRAQECGKMFYFYENDLDSGTDCNHVLFFWRIKRMLEFTANSLRRQILEDECRRIEREIVEVLDEYSENDVKKAKLLSGKRVELAEELRRVRQIQEKLDEFIYALNQDGNF